MATWKIATVQPDYHILFYQMFYSVPFRYISSQVDVRLTNTLVEIFFKDSRIDCFTRPPLWALWAQRAILNQSRAYA